MFDVGNFLLWLHLTAVTIWLGSTFFSITLIPGAKRLNRSPLQVAETIEYFVRLFRIFSWELPGFVFITGVFNLLSMGMKREFRFGKDYLLALCLKLILLLLMGIGQGLIVHVFWPKLVTICRSMNQIPSTESNHYQKIRGRIIGLSVANLLGGVIGLYVGLGMRRLF